MLSLRPPLKDFMADTNLSSFIGSIAQLLPWDCKQSDIVDFIETETAQLDTSNAAAERTIEFRRKSRTALISAAVTGKIDVRGLAGKASA